MYKMCTLIPTTYEKTKNHNTNYYRRNKAQRFNVKCCPHCNYETTGPKSALQAHIWSKHTPEKERPFQCPCHECERGFSARANLNKHILKKHKIIMPKKIDKDVLIYKIDIQLGTTKCDDNFVCNMETCTYKTKSKGDLKKHLKCKKHKHLEETLKYYKEIPYIVAKDLPITTTTTTITNNNTIVNTRKITFDSLFYDKGRGLINITPYTKEEIKRKLI